MRFLPHRKYYLHFQLKDDEALEALENALATAFVVVDSRPGPGAFEFFLTVVAINLEDFSQIDMLVQHVFQQANIPSTSIVFARANQDLEAMLMAGWPDLHTDEKVVDLTPLLTGAAQ